MYISIQIRIRMCFKINNLSTLSKQHTASPTVLNQIIYICCWRCLSTPTHPSEVESWWVLAVISVESWWVLAVVVAVPVVGGFLYYLYTIVKICTGKVGIPCNIALFQKNMWMKILILFYFGWRLGRNFVCSIHIGLI